MGVGLRTWADNPGWGMEWTPFGVFPAVPFLPLYPTRIGHWVVGLKRVMPLSKGQRSKENGNQPIRAGVN